MLLAHPQIMPQSGETLRRSRRKLRAHVPDDLLNCLYKVGRLLLGSLLALVHHVITSIHAVLEGFPERFVLDAVAEERNI
jgi:hypothetical protein